MVPKQRLVSREWDAETSRTTQLVFFLEFQKQSCSEIFSQKPFQWKLLKIQFKGKKYLEREFRSEVKNRFLNLKDQIKNNWAGLVPKIFSRSLISVQKPPTKRHDCQNQKMKWSDSKNAIVSFILPKPVFVQLCRHQRSFQMSKTFFCCHENYRPIKTSCSVKTFQKNPVLKKVKKIMWWKKFEPEKQARCRFSRSS